MSESVVVVGASMGGLRALQILLSGLPAAFPAPVVVVQHRLPTQTRPLSNLLSRHTQLSLCEAEDKVELEAGFVYLAPPDYHIFVDRDEISLSIDPPVNHSRPSVDVLFESAAAAFGERAIGVVMTGSTSDGARGAARIHEAGGIVIAQDPSTAESGVMPAAAVAATSVDAVLALEGIAQHLQGIFQRGKVSHGR